MVCLDCAGWASTPFGPNGRLFGICNSEPQIIRICNPEYVNFNSHGPHFKVVFHMLPAHGAWWHAYVEPLRGFWVYCVYLSMGWHPWLVIFKPIRACVFEHINRYEN